ncbi:MAG TPA: type II toxin-antitoxin system Phd/YefM family antitoxin [Candidatus Polarisedimenticolaceae bacterium]|nr:type II toxin-antitoxin system Phd/YefM family antitoxin [Candidatus Polarisedimenticolaceae bacterium]
MKKVALSEVKDDLSRLLRLAEKEEVVITRHGKAAGVLIGFESEDDWFDYRLEKDPRFLQRVEAARESLRGNRGVKLEDVGRAGGPVPNRTLQRTVSRVTARAKKATGRATRSRRRA